MAVAVTAVLDNKCFEVVFAQNQTEYRNRGNNWFTNEQNILSHIWFKNTMDADQKL